MGWGGRMVGACSLDIQNYIGIDLNKDLKKPLSDMVKFISPYTQTKIKLFFKDALTIDYSKLYYDFVLTSPPYYNIEQYKYNEKLTKEEWDNNFYIPIITKTYEHLQKNGVYCLNIPSDVYEVVKNILGKSDKKIQMWKSPRTEKNKKEWIYVWYK
jgi:site-specific DNA-adenine methylase